MQEIDTSFTTPVSTLVAELLLSWEQSWGTPYGSYKDINRKIDSKKIQEDIVQIIKNINIWDINNDGLIDGKDLHAFRMVNNTSPLIQEMKNNGFITRNIHTKNNTNTDSYIEKKKVEINLINPTQTSESYATKINMRSNYPYLRMEYSFDGINYWPYLTDITVVPEQNIKTVSYRGVYANGAYSKVENLEIKFSPIQWGGTTGQVPWTENLSNNNWTWSSTTIPNNGSTTGSSSNTPESWDLWDPKNNQIIVIQDDLKSYAPIAINWAIQKEISDLSTQIWVLNSDIAQLITTKSSKETDITQKTQQLSQTEQALQTRYNNLDSTSKKMVDGSLTQSDKITYLNNTYGTSSGTIYTSFIAPRIMQLASFIWGNDLNINVDTWLAALITKRNDLTTELQTLQNNLNNKKTLYDNKYAEYLRLVAEYNADQQNYRNSLAQYNIYKNNYTTWLNEFKNLWTIAWMGLDIYSIINQWSVDIAMQRVTERRTNFSLPNPNKYNPDKTTQSNRNGVVYSYPEVNLLWGRFQVKIVYWMNGWSLNFPAEIYTENLSTWINNWKITIKNNTHGSDIRVVLENIGICDVTSSRLRALKADYDKREYYFVETLVYGLLKSVWSDMYKSEYDAYSKAKNDYDILSVTNENKKSELATIEWKIRSFWTEVTTKQQLSAALYNTQSDLAQIKTVLADKNYTVTVLSWKYESANKQYTTTVDSKINIATSNYSPSTLFPYNTLSQQYAPNTTTQAKNQDYTRFPYTTYAKYNRVWNNLDYPALVWMEYKINANDELIYTTERIEVKNESHKTEAKIFLQSKVMERIDAKRANLKTNIMTKELEKARTNTISNNSLFQELQNNALQSNIDNLKKIWLGSANFIKWMWDGILQAGKDSIPSLSDAWKMIANVTVWTYKGIEKTFDLTSKWLAFWAGKIYKEIRNDAIGDQLYKNLSDVLEWEWLQTLNHIEEFKTEAKELTDAAKNIFANLDRIENGEYWGAFITGYINTVVTEWAAQAAVMKNAKAAWIATKSGPWYIALQKMFLQFKTAIEIGKLTLKKVDIGIIKSLEAWRSLYGNNFDNTLKDVFILWDKYNIDKRTLYHLANGEWYENGALKSWLHSMQKVEELLKEGKIKIQTKTLNNGSNWEDVDYNRYKSLDDITKQNIKVKWANDTREFKNIASSWKSLFPGHWTSEDTASLISKAESNIHSILTKRLLPEIGTPNTYWKNIKINWVEVWEIIENFTVNWKVISVKIWWKYDANWKLNYRIETIYP